MSDQGKIPHSLEFDDLAPVRVPVRLGARHFVLRPATAGEVIQYRNFIVRTTKVNTQDRSASTQGYADSEPYLLAMCLTEVKEGGREVPVSIQTIKGWRNEVLNKVFDLLQRISGMLEEEEKPTREQLLAQREELDGKLAELPADPLMNGEHSAADPREEAVKNG